MLAVIFKVCQQYLQLNEFSEQKFKNNKLFPNIFVFLEGNYNEQKHSIFSDIVW